MQIAIVTKGKSRRSLEAIMACAVTLNAICLETHDETQIPYLYDSGIRYRREPRGRPVYEGREERWDTIPQVMEQGWGDCDDLAMWRVAELNVREGIAARAIFEEVGMGSWHVLVEHPDGTLEDPSEHLGMYEQLRTG
jgi:hypothetical protein